VATVATGWAEDAAAKPRIARRRCNAAAGQGVEYVAPYITTLEGASSCRAAGLALVAQPYVGEPGAVRAGPTVLLGEGCQSGSVGIGRERNGSFCGGGIGKTSSAGREKEQRHLEEAGDKPRSHGEPPGSAVPGAFSHGPLTEFE